jgi:endonuclease YncB( thermonuclease family)
VVARKKVARLRPVHVGYAAGSTVIIREGSSGDSSGQAEESKETSAESTSATSPGDQAEAVVPAASPTDADTSLADQPAYEVKGVKDGGLTVVIQVDGEETNVRMLGVAPTETGKGEAGDRPRREGSGRRPAPSQMFLENLLRGESVYVVYDSQVEEQDEDGKYVAYLYRAPDGLMINLEVVRQGFCVTDPDYDFTEKPSFLYYQEKAAKAKKGLWGGPKRMGPPRSRMGDRNRPEGRKR